MSNKMPTRETKATRQVKSIVQRFRDLIFNEKEWCEIEAMTDDDLRWEFCKLLDESLEGRYQTQRFRRVCYRMALRFEQIG